MKINFETRKKARAYCKQQGLRPKDIKYDANSPQPWYINVDELTGFVVGQWYRISDETGFINNNTANKIQLQQIKKFLPDGFKITKSDGYTAEFEHPTSVSFFTLRAEEIQYMTKISDPTVKPAVSVIPVGSAKDEPKPVASIVVDPSLDDELNEPVFELGKSYELIRKTYFKRDPDDELHRYIENHCGGTYTITSYDSDKDEWSVSVPGYVGGTPAVVKSKERKHFKEVDVSDRFIAGTTYCFSDAKSFINEEPYHNNKIVEAINHFYHGIITIDTVNDEGGANILDPLNVISSGSRFLWKRERNFVKPCVVGVSDVQEKEIFVDSRIEYLKKEISELTSKLATAQEELFKLL